MDAKKKILPVDELIAQRLRAARLAAGFSQEKAAAALGLTFQQLQKYEKAVNRISLGRLVVLAKMYRRPLAWFFAGVEEGAAPARDLGAELLATSHGKELAEAFVAIANPDSRRAVVDVAIAIAGMTALKGAMAKAA